MLKYMSESCESVSRPYKSKLPHIFPARRGRVNIWNHPTAVVTGRDLRGGSFRWIILMFLYLSVGIRMSSIVCYDSAFKIVLDAERNS